MNAKERYNIIIYTIEDIISKQLELQLKPIEISNMAFEQSGCSYIDIRGRNALFQFLTGMGLNDYINKRMMMYAYNTIIHSSSLKKAIQESITISGVENQSSFNKKFKKLFSMTPSDAFTQKNDSLIEDAYDWDHISNEGKIMFTELNKVADLQSTIFGMPTEKYNNLQHASELQDYYGLNNHEANIAYKIFDTKGYSLEDTFLYVYRYINEYLHSVDVLSNLGGGTSPEEIIERDLLDEHVIKFYFEYDFGFYLIHNILHFDHKYRQLELTDTNLPKSALDLHPFILAAVTVVDEDQYYDGNMIKNSLLSYALDVVDYLEQYDCSEYTAYDFCKFCMLYKITSDLDKSFSLVDPGLIGDISYKSLYDDCEDLIEWLNTIPKKHLLSEEVADESNDEIVNIEADSNADFDQLEEELEEFVGADLQIKIDNGYNEEVAHCGLFDFDWDDNFNTYKCGPKGENLTSGEHNQESQSGINYDKILDDILR